jgi:hypothetical protein
VTPPRCSAEACGRFVPEHSLNGLCDKCEQEAWERFCNVVALEWIEEPAR